MVRHRRDAAYTSFSYLESGTDYEPFELAPERDRVPGFLLPLEPGEEQRAEELARRCIMISLHDHAFPFPRRIEQTPAYVRVAHGPVRVQEWYRLPDPEVLLVAETGTILAVLDQDDDWFWVVVPPDAHGTRRAGWIRTARSRFVVTVYGTVGASSPYVSVRTTRPASARTPWRNSGPPAAPSTT